MDRNWKFLSWSGGEISLEFKDQNCLKTFLTRKKNNKSFEMENLSLCCSLSDGLWICGAALTRCRMSPSIQCFQPLLFFSPFWTQTSLSPSQVTRDCMNQIINSHYPEVYEHIKISSNNVNAQLQLLPIILQLPHKKTPKHLNKTQMHSGWQQCDRGKLLQCLVIISMCFFTYTSNKCSH